MKRFNDTRTDKFFLKSKIKMLHKVTFLGDFARELARPISINTPDFPYFIF